MRKGKEVVTSNVNYILENKSQCLTHLSNIGVQEEYGTPQKLFDEKCTELDLNLQIDVAASHTNHVLPHYITKEDDLFTKQITQDAFLNPPYGRVIVQFIKYIYEQHLKHNVTILLLIFNKTDTQWWHKYIEGKAEVHNIKGRIQFNDKNGNPKMIYNKKYNKWNKGFAPYPSAWVLYRSKP